MEQSGLALDEVEQLAGRFKPHSCRAGSMRGEAVIDPINYKIKLRHHFTKKLIWEGELYDRS